MARKVAEPSADDLLSGRVRPTAAALLRAIHTVNPTGHALPRKEEERRYVRKARLQSMLVEHFADDLIVTRDGDAIVTLRHRHLGLDACHAVIDALDDHARSWIRRRLDEGDEEGEPIAPSRRPRATPFMATGALAEARGAIDEYDFERARTLLEEALHADEDDVDVSACLVELLVDHLACDTEALALALSDRARDDRRIAQRLAVARVRIALEAGDLAEAERTLPLANDVGLRDELARRRAARREAAEVELLRQLSAHTDAEGRAAHARAFLATWKESAAARRALRAAEEEVAERDHARAIEDSAQLEAEGKLEEAIGALRVGLRACERTGKTREHVASLTTRLETLQRRLEEDERARVIERVLHGLATIDAASLSAYAALDEELRARVRAREGIAALGFVDAALEHGSPRQAVEATIALMDAMAAREPLEAAALLRPHEARLGSIPLARTIFEQATSARREDRERAALSKLREAKLAFEGSRLDEAARKLAGVARSDLSADHVAELEALGEAIDRRRDRDVLMRTLDATIAKQPFAARDALDALEARHPDAGIDLASMRVDLEQRVARHFRIEIEHGAWPLAERSDLADRRMHGDPCFVVAEREGRLHACVVDVEGHWVFAYVVDLAAERVVTRLRFRAPLAFETEVWAWDGMNLHVVGEGMMLVRTTDGRLESWSQAMLPGRWINDGRFLASDGRHAWSTLRDRVTREERVDIFDAIGSRGIRTLRFMTACPLQGSPARVLTAGRDASAIYDARGQLVERIGVPLGAAAPLPSGALAAFYTERDREEDLEIWLKRPGEHDAHRGTVIADADPSYMQSICAAGGKLVVCARAERFVPFVAVFEESESTLREVARAPFVDTSLLVDAEGNHAFAIVPSANGSRVVDLTRPESFPEFPAQSKPVGASFVFCGGDPVFAAAESAFYECDAAAMRTALGALDDLDEPDHGVHAHHLRVLVALLENDLVAARATLETAKQHAQARCELDELGHLVDGLDRRPCPVPMRALLDALEAAEHARASGDYASVLRTLDGHAVHHARELQTLARRAEALLATGDRTRPPPFETCRTLARLCVVANEPWAANLIATPSSWPRTRIDAVIRDATTWLDSA